ncbi:MAG: glucosylglycerol hydrolase [Synechococcus sp.]|nr:glucosylglycerol hydrolase [Synechococcus sp.]
MNTASHPQLIEADTQVLLDWVTQVTHADDSYFHRGQRLARRLGAHYRPDGLTEIGFWTPELAGEVIQTNRDIFLEIFTPLESVDFSAPTQVIKCRRDCVELKQQGEFCWGVVAGMRPGSRRALGSLYWLRYCDRLQDQVSIIRDVLAYSLPYGVFGPAELYDIDKMQRERADLAYFAVNSQQAARDQAPWDRPILENADQVIPRVPAPLNILQVHLKTASPEGTLAGLTKIYQTLSAKLATGEALSPAEQNYVGYDALQLLPIEPTIEYRLEGDNRHHEFLAIAPNELIETGQIASGLEVEVTLRKPKTQNWGYDVPILGSAATNPTILESLRPDELVDFIATLHNFSTGPIQVIYDLVYGHADNQAMELINSQYLKGPNMYGQDLNHQLPQVRAVLLELQRRRINSGADGIRIDGGQDFRFFNPLSGRVEQDDAYLLGMSDVVQEINGQQRLLFTIFEDGRPWPEEGWEQSSTYRDLIELRPDSYQWGPLIFAHNTPTLEGFWDYKWNRIIEVMFQGDRWITGCANHDTVRRGNQIDAKTAAINWHLGSTLNEVILKAYDNPATTLWVYGFMPGLPMDFINALMHTPWGFFRNTDELYGVKVAAEEVGFLEWQITPALFDQPWAFRHLKQLGFQDLDLLQRFMGALNEAMIVTDYDLQKTADLCQRCIGNPEGHCEVKPMQDIGETDHQAFLDHLTVAKLKTIAMAFMEDGHETCRVSHYHDQVKPAQAAFNLALRHYRHGHPWLRENLQEGDRFNRLSNDDHTIFYGLRTEPLPPDRETTPEQIVMVAHMGGKPTTVTLGDWLQLDLDEWRVAIATPGLNIGQTKDELQVFELQDSQGLILERIR